MTNPTFTLHGKQYTTVVLDHSSLEHPSWKQGFWKRWLESPCKGCAAHRNNDLCNDMPDCDRFLREDGENVIFKEVVGYDLHGK